MVTGSPLKCFSLKIANTILHIFFPSKVHLLHTAQHQFAISTQLLKIPSVPMETSNSFNLGMRAKPLKPLLKPSLKLGEPKHENYIKLFKKRKTQTFMIAPWFSEHEKPRNRNKPSQRTNHTKFDEKNSPHLPNARQCCFEKLLPWSPSTQFLKSMCSPLATNIHQRQAAKIHKDNIGW